METSTEVWTPEIQQSAGMRNSMISDVGSDTTWASHEVSGVMPRARRCITVWSGLALGVPAAGGTAVVPCMTLLKSSMGFINKGERRADVVSAPDH